MIGRQWQLLLGFAAGLSVAQTQSLSPDSRSRFEFERIGVVEGLPTEYVNCMTQDRYGFLIKEIKNFLKRVSGFHE